MLRSYLIGAKRDVTKKKKGKVSRAVLELRLMEVEQEHKRCQELLLSQIEALQLELRSAGGDNVSLSREVEDLRANLAAAQNLADQMEQQVQHIQTLHEAEKRQSEQDTQEQSLRTQETEDLRQRYETLKERLAASEVLFQEKANEGEKEKEKERKRYDTLKEHHNELSQAHEKMKERVTETEVRLHETAELRRKYEMLKESSDTMRQNHEQLKEKLIENENFLRTQEGKIAARFEKQLAESRCECAQARADRDDFEANLDTCKRQLQAAREQNAKLRAYFEESEDVDKENRNTNNKQGFLSHALGQARRTLQLGHK